MLATMWPASLNYPCISQEAMLSGPIGWPYFCSNLIFVLNFLRFIVFIFYLSYYALCNLFLFTDFSHVNILKDFTLHTLSYANLHNEQDSWSFKSLNFVVVLAASITAMLTKERKLGTELKQQD